MSVKNTKPAPNKYYCSACDEFLKTKRQCSHPDCKAIPLITRVSENAQVMEEEPLAKAS